MRGLCGCARFSRARIFSQGGHEGPGYAKKGEILSQGEHEGPGYVRKRGGGNVNVVWDHVNAVAS